MSLSQGIKAIQPSASPNKPYIFGFLTARSAAGDTLVEAWNGSSAAASVFEIDKDGIVDATTFRVEKDGGTFFSLKDTTAGQLNELNAGFNTDGTEAYFRPAPAGTPATDRDFYFDFDGDYWRLDGDIMVDGVVYAEGSLAMTGDLSLAAGTEASPSLDFSGDNNTGLYRIGADNIGVSLGGTKYVDLSTARADFSMPVQVTTDTDLAIKFVGSPTNNIHEIGANTTDGADDQGVRIEGGGGSLVGRGASVTVFGNEHAVDPGQVNIRTGDAAETGDGIVLSTSADIRLINCDKVELDGDLDHDGANIGFFGVAPAARAAAYTPSNVTPDRSFDADTVLVAELADVVGTLIADLQLYGLLQ